MSTGLLLDDVLGTHSNVRVLRTLHRVLPSIALSGRDVGRRSGVSHPSATASLRMLTDVGLVRVRRARRADYYELNRDHLLAADLARLFEREAEYESRRATADEAAQAVERAERIVVWARDALESGRV